MFYEKGIITASDPIVWANISTFKHMELFEVLLISAVSLSHVILQSCKIGGLTSEGKPPKPKPSYYCIHLRRSLCAPSFIFKMYFTIALHRDLFTHFQPALRIWLHLESHRVRHC